MAEQTENSEDTLPIRRARLDSVDVYEITESELDSLKQGGSSSLLLTFSTALLGAGFSLLMSTLANPLDPEKHLGRFIIIWIFIAVILAGGMILLLLWKISHKSTRELVQKIVRRMPSEPYPDRDKDAEDAVSRAP